MDTGHQVHTPTEISMYCRSGFDCGILLTVNYEFFSITHNQTNHSKRACNEYYTQPPPFCLSSAYVLLHVFLPVQPSCRLYRYRLRWAFINTSSQQSAYQHPAVANIKDHGESLWLAIFATQLIYIYGYGILLIASSLTASHTFS